MFWRWFLKLFFRGVTALCCTFVNCQTVTLSSSFAKGFHYKLFHSVIFYLFANPHLLFLKMKLSLFFFFLSWKLDLFLQSLFLLQQRFFECWHLYLHFNFLFLNILRWKSSLALSCFKWLQWAIVRGINA